MSRPVVDLPQPDSPTRPSEPPRGTSNETPSTACTWPIVRRTSPEDFTGKYIFRLSTVSIGSASGSSAVATWPVLGELVEVQRLVDDLVVVHDVDVVASRSRSPVSAALAPTSLGVDPHLGVGVLGHRVSSTRSGAISGSTSVW